MLSLIPASATELTSEEIVPRRPRIFMSIIDERLQKLSEIDGMPDDHVQYLYYLRDSCNFHPRVIYDIGSCVLHWTKVAHRVWPYAKIIAFDGLRWTTFLHEQYKEEHGSDLFDYHIDVLSHEDRLGVRWHENPLFPTGCSYYREIGSRLYENSVGHPRIARTLDSVVRARDFPKPDLVKIDVQGAEIDVLNGGREAMQGAQHLIVELQSVPYNEGAWIVDQSKALIEQMGWICKTPRPFSRGHPDGDYHFARV